MRNKIKSVLSIINFNILIRLPIIFVVFIFIFYFDEFKSITIVQLFKGVASLIAGWLLYLRFKTTDDIKKNQEEQFHLTNQYSHFLETSKLLTDKNSTLEGKISAMYLLYDYAKNYPQEVEKVYQLLSEYSKPLLNCIDGNCNYVKYTKIKDSLEVEKLNKKMIFKYQKNNLLAFDIHDTKSVKTITTWQIDGTSTEKLVSIALIMIRDITVNVLPKVTEHIELSNIIIFNLNVDYIKDNNLREFKSIIRPTYSLVFLDCNLKGVDFSKSKFYYCKFINCDLDRANFKECDLKKTTFIKSDLKDVIFEDVINIESQNFQECDNVPLQ